MMQLTRRGVLKLLATMTVAPALEGIPASSLPSRRERGTYRDPSFPIEKRVQDLLARMTVEEKARQLDMYAALSDRVQPLADWDAKFLKQSTSQLAFLRPSTREKDLDVKTGKDAIFGSALAETV